MSSPFDLNCPERLYRCHVIVDATRSLVEIGSFLANDILVSDNMTSERASDADEHLPVRQQSVSGVATIENTDSVMTPSNRFDRTKKPGPTEGSLVADKAGPLPSSASPHVTAPSKDAGKQETKSHDTEPRLGLTVPIDI